MADDLCVWLESCLSRFPASKDKQITVVGVIGNSSSTQNELPELINRHLFGSRYVFRGEATSQPSIEAFFSPREDILYLVLHRPNDWGGRMSRENPKDLKEEHNALLAKIFHIMFSLCHVILMTGDHCRFDMHWLKEFKMVQSKRLEECDGFERQETPRLLFAFPAKSAEEVPFRKRREMTNKLEESLESLIYSVLKKNSIIDRLGARLIIATLPSKGEKFVHIFREEVKRVPQYTTSGSTTQPTSDARTTVAGERSTVEILDTIEAFTAKDRDSRDNLALVDFLREVIADVRRWRRRGRRASGELPTLEEFVPLAERVCRSQFDQPQLMSGKIEGTEASPAPYCNTLVSLDKRRVD